MDSHDCYFALAEHIRASVSAALKMYVSTGGRDHDNWRPTSVGRGNLPYRWRPKSPLRKSVARECAALFNPCTNLA